MTDWLPWGLVLMAGVFVTLDFLIRAVVAVPGVDARWLRRARFAYWVTVAMSLAVYALYVMFGESWIWYMQR